MNQEDEPCTDYDETCEIMTHCQIAYCRLYDPKGTCRMTLPSTEITADSPIVWTIEEESHEPRR